jgi:hypothetical protein
MGVMITHKLYEVVTLFDCLQNPAMQDWLVQNDLPVPDDIPHGRYPSPMEIKGVVESIQGIRTDYVISQRVWQVSFFHRKDVSWAVLAVRDYFGDPDAPHRFDFIAGWDEIIDMVCLELVKICGPLVLLPDSGAPPKIFM